VAEKIFKKEKEEEGKGQQKEGHPGGFGGAAADITHAAVEKAMGKSKKNW